MSFFNPLPGAFSAAESASPAPRDLPLATAGGLEEASRSLSTASAGDDTIYGTGGDDSFRGEGGDDLIYGDYNPEGTTGSGADTLRGGAGADTLIGGGSDDTLFTDEGRDLGLEVDAVFGEGGNDTLSIGYGDSADGGTGTDSLSLVLSSMSSGAVIDLSSVASGGSFTVGTGTITQVEKLTNVQGSDFADTIRLSASWSGSTLHGNDGNDVLEALGNGTKLFGDDGSDRLLGGAFDDLLDGGLGIDTADYARVGAGVTVSLLTTAQQDTGGGGKDTLNGIENLAGSAFADTLTGSTGENLLVGAAGNDRLLGGEGSDTLEGGSGADTLLGGLGDDVFLISDALDTVTEAAGQGLDEVRWSAASGTYTLSANVENLTLSGTAALGGTGNALANRLIGNSANNTLGGGDGADTLNGGVGADTLTGGTGNDAYVVDNVSDRVVETAGAGVDSVQASVTWTLSAEIENLSLSGAQAINATGNALDNQLVGNNAANVLNGGAGNDTLTGAGGADTYVVTSTGDQVVELAGGGIDKVNASVSWTLGAEVEHLVLTGTAATNGTGNALDNQINGNSADNLLDGKAGRDTLSGGSGNDTYWVDDTRDQVVEVSGGGLDTVNASVSWSLDSAVERLVLTGTAALNGAGNEVANTLTGNSAANVLAGGAGADRLIGGGGADTFVMDSLVGSDTVTDFQSGTDKLRILQSAIAVGDGDASLERAVQVFGPGGFSKAAELVIVSEDISGAITTTSAAAAIGSATSAYSVGQTALFVVDNGVQSNVYLFEAANADAVVSASELVLLSTLSGTASTTVTDYIFGA